MPNPSELARLEAELDELRSALKDKRFTRPKSVKESMLSDIRHLEKLLGLPSEPYNKA